jgi:hypothetical protein
LEANDGGGHDGEPDEREGGLAARETGVEEAVRTSFLVCVCQGWDLSMAYPTPGIMSSTNAVEVIIQPMSPAS